MDSLDMEMRLVRSFFGEKKNQMQMQICVVQ